MTPWAKRGSTGGTRQRTGGTKLLVDSLPSVRREVFRAVHVSRDRVAAGRKYRVSVFVFLVKL
jgi:hypothetical protein